MDRSRQEPNNNPLILATLIVLVFVSMMIGVSLFFHFNREPQQAASTESTTRLSTFSKTNETGIVSMQIRGGSDPTAEEMMKVLNLWGDQNPTYKVIGMERIPPTRVPGVTEYILFVEQKQNE